MVSLLFGTALLVATKSAFVSGFVGGITAVSWGGPRVDVFGVAPDKTIWHKYDIGYPIGWKPENGLFENMLGIAPYPPVAVSWNEGRLDYFVIGGDYAAYHKYWDGSQWLPAGKWHERLEGKFTSQLAVASWAEDRFDIVGRNTRNGYSHKAWTGKGWFPKGTGWEDLGGNFSSAPSIVSWGPGRCDIIGIDAEKGSIKRMHITDVGPSDWEDLGGGPFVGTPLITSWGVGRLNIWVAGKDGQLNYKYWNEYDYRYSKWEQLGGNFSTAPAVVHWDVGKIDIVGLWSNDTRYHSKYWNDNEGRWGPSYDGWYDKGGDFAAQPALVARNGTNNLYVLGVNSTGFLKLQYFDGSSYSWQPGTQQYWDLGNTQKPYASSFRVEEDRLRVQELK